MSLDLERFRAGFLDEVEEHIETIEHLLLSGDARTSNREQLDAIFRAAHSIKGGAGTFGFTELATVTHRLESVFDRIRNGELVLGDEVVDAALHALDSVRAIVAAHRVGAPVSEGTGAQAIAELQRFLEIPALPARGGSTTSPTVYDIAFTCADEGKRASTYDALLGAVASSGEMLSFDLSDVFRVTLRTGKPEAELREIFAFVAGEDDRLELHEQRRDSATESFGLFDGTAQNVNRSSSQPNILHERKGVHKDESIRVSLAKVDQLINLVGEIVTAENILAAAIRRSADHLTNTALADAAEKVARHTRDLRQIVMSIRMVPISFILGRFPRVVRETATKLGKQVELRLSGEETELDKTIVERIVDPLTHLVRNAVDHGIEPPEERIAAGKPAQGRLELIASHRSGNIVIEVIDDGRGLDRRKLIAKARRNGIEIADDAPDKEVWDLIFAPGFSTASQVTEISGRGVGMDVVRRNVAELGGNITIDSEPGAGMRVTINLPLTLAILDGLTVLVGRSTFVVPIANVVSSLQPTPEIVKRLPDGNEAVYFHDAWIPLRRLHRIFRIADALGDPQQGIVVVVESGGRRAALLVDALEAQQQLVIKSIETNFRKTPGIAGATVIDNGAIALIIDVLTFVHSDLETAA
jgi:two-component system chemotaxis sensor kinase CheA